LALAMAEVIVRERLARPPADAGRLRETLERHAPDRVAQTVGVDADLIERLAREFAASGAPLAVAGGMAAHYANGAEIVAAVNVLNYVAGAVGTTVHFDQDLAVGASYGDLVAVRDEMAAGGVSVLLVHGANPAYSLGAGFQDAAARVPFKVSFATVLDETAAAADLVLPDLHPLEQWNDVTPRAGIAALQQPVVRPVVDARSAGAVILELMDRSETMQEYVQARWRSRTRGGANTDQGWLDALQRGGDYGTAPVRAVRLGSEAGRIAAGAPALDGAAGDVTLVVFPHAALHDGRGANKPWLQELPDPVSKIAWHAWAGAHPETAATWGVVSGDIVELTTAAGTVRAPVWVTPSVRPGVVAVPTGQGHTAYGRYAAERSFNAFALAR
jgi:molybdopterin-containing oxidoreductase family iron-sulfur binding subunit